MTGLRFRSVLDQIPAYKAGKPPAAGAAESYKLSSNENPFEPLPGVLEAVGLTAATMNRYPDPAVTGLREMLGERLGVSPDAIVTGTGSVAVFYHLVQALCDPGDEVVYAWRSFEAYPIAVGLAGASSVQVPVLPDGRHDLEGMLAAITDRTRIVVVCTPNNPTGPAVSQRELAEFVARVPSNVAVVVDEAYREFVRSDDPVDAVPLIGDHPNVLSFRTFSKAYGLAALRVGYAVTTPEVGAEVRKCALPFGVSQIAQAAAIASLAAEDELLARVDQIVAERDRVTAALREQGWQFPDTQANFVWFPLGDDSLDFAQRCEEAGVSVRPFQGDGVRVTIDVPTANDLLLGVAAGMPVRGEGIRAS